MTSLNAALDNMSTLKLGENLNQEYNWTSTDNKISTDNLRKLIVEFNFQLTRTSNHDQLEIKYKTILKHIFVKDPSPEHIEMIAIVYKLINYTRDIINGKGEYTLTYMLISNLYNFSISEVCPSEHKYRILSMCKECIYSFIYIPKDNNSDNNSNNNSNNKTQPYGSWKDMKYFCNYHIKEQRHPIDIEGLSKLNDPLFEYIITLFCTQLRNDIKYKITDRTLVARWIPREKSKKFGWITHVLAVRYYAQYIPPLNNEQITETQRTRAKRKCLTHFRQLVAKLNKDLNTPQINQCNKTWKEIDFDKHVTSITLRKQSKAFLNTNKSYSNHPSRYNRPSRPDPLHPNEQDEDRVECRENYRKYMSNIKSGKSVAKGKRVSITDFVSSAIRYSDSIKTETFSGYETPEDVLEKEMINAQWNNNTLQNSQLENIIPMVDTSLSMTADNCLPLHAAIGLGIRIAEKSKFGKRVLTFSNAPKWVNLDDCTNFVDMVQKVRTAPWGANTNFRAALDLILDAAIQNNIAPSEMEKMVLIILSDMQIDYGKTPSDNEPMFEMMKEKYRLAGLKTHYQQPYKLPHIIFWNLRNTNCMGFPCISSTQNTSMMSGINPVLLNNFANKGINELKSITPWHTLLQELSNTRYQHLDNTIKILFTLPTIQTPTP